jgi:hypothetical protein
VNGDPTLGGLLGPLPKLPAGQSRVSSTSEVGGPDGRPSDVDPAGGAGEPAPGRLEQARAEIARRRDITRSAVTVLDADWTKREEPWPTAVFAGRPEQLSMRLLTSRRRATHILDNDPAHVLQVLAAADATLDRHGPCPECFPHSPDPHCEGDGLAWPCPDAAAVLDLYAPAVQR